MKKSKAKDIAFYGIMIALAFIFSYLESFIPVNALIPIPGVKLGLANIVILFALYTNSIKQAIVIAIIRVLLSGLLFGNPMTIAYSLCGCALSLMIMWATKKTEASEINAILNDVHSPAKVRVNAVLSAMDKFYEVFNVNSSNGMYKAPEERPSIW